MTHAGPRGNRGRPAPSGMDDPKAVALNEAGAGEAPALEVRELEVPFGEQPGLRGISFRVRAGERFALVGSSGAGKTSLLRAMAGSGSLIAGRILVEGRDVTALPQERRGTVLLAQRPLLFPHLSVFENVAFPLRVRGVGREEILRRVEEALALVRMEEFGSRRPHSLSGGQAHRVALTRAVVARPPVLLLDEPLTSLDPSLREEVRRSILAVHSEYRPALILVTHDLEEAGRMADQLGVLLDGSLVQVASPDRLFRQPASVAVARFLGLPNELPGRIRPDGSLILAGWRIVELGWGGEGNGVQPLDAQRAGPANLEGRDVTVVFGTEAGRLLPRGAGGIPARAEEVRHHPEGAVARVTLMAAAAVPARRSAPSLPSSCQLAVDANSPPAIGEEVGVTFIRGRMHVFDV